MNAEEFAKLLLEPISIPSLGKAILLPHHVALIESRDATIRAEALREAADRAVEYLQGWGVDPYIAEDGIRKAILAGDVKE